MKKRPLSPTKHLDSELATAKHVEVIRTASGAPIRLYGNRSVADAGTEMLRLAIRGDAPSHRAKIAELAVAV